MTGKKTSDKYNDKANKLEEIAVNYNNKAVRTRKAPIGAFFLSAIMFQAMTRCAFCWWNRVLPRLPMIAWRRAPKKWTADWIPTPQGWTMRIGFVG